jgi:hypothetical protein
MISPKALAGHLVSIIHQVLNLPYSLTFSSTFMSTPEGVEHLQLFYSSSSSWILEYGSGNSTVYAIENQKSIVSVETDYIFFRQLCIYLTQAYPCTFTRLPVFSRKNPHILFSSTCKSYNLLWINAGITGRYGMPLLKSRVQTEALARLYLMTVYQLFNDIRFDRILIDGRWRKACYFYSIFKSMELKACPYILIDDCNEPIRGLHQAVSASGLRYKTLDSEGRLILSYCDRAIKNRLLIENEFHNNLFNTL